MKPLLKRAETLIIAILLRETGKEMATSEIESCRSSFPPTRIMIAVNQSSMKGYPFASISSRSAFEWTMEKIVRDNGAGFQILILHVQVPDEDGFNDLDSIYASPKDFKDMQRREMKRGLHLLEHFVERCYQIGVGCEAWIKKGDPKNVILSEVKRLHPDFLVVGQRGLGPFQKVFVGTVSEFCLKHAECPVITIKRRSDQTPHDPAND